MVITILPPQKVTRKMRIRNISKRSVSEKTGRASANNSTGPSQRVTSSYNFGKR